MCGAHVAGVIGRDLWERRRLWCRETNGVFVAGIFGCTGLALMCAMCVDVLGIFWAYLNNIFGKYELV